MTLRMVRGGARGKGQVGEEMAEDGGTLLYMMVGLLVVVGAIVSLTGRRQGARSFAVPDVCYGSPLRVAERLRRKGR